MLKFPARFRWTKSAIRRVISPSFQDEGDHAMAKGQLRSTREKKKPKKVKPKETQAASPFSKQSSSGTPKQAGAKG
jgi:hypothetical protein